MGEGAGARLEAWTPEGDLLVSSPASGAVDELIPGPRAAPPPSPADIGPHRPQGLAFDKLGGHEVLYVAEANEIDRYVAGGRASARAR